MKAESSDKELYVGHPPEFTKTVKTGCELQVKKARSERLSFCYESDFGLN